MKQIKIFDENTRGKLTPEMKYSLLMESFHDANNSFNTIVLGIQNEESGLSYLCGGVSESTIERDRIHLNVPYRSGPLEFNLEEVAEAYKILERYVPLNYKSPKIEIPEAHPEKPAFLRKIMGE